MCKVQMLRALVKQRLTAAAEEIFGLIDRTIAEYEEEVCRLREENERLQREQDATDVQQLLVVKEEVPPEQQEWCSSLDQEDPEPPHIKEEQEEHCGWPEPARNSDQDTHLQPDTEDKTGDSLKPETDDGKDDWKETREPQSGLNNVPVSDLRCSTGDPEPPHIKEEQEEEQLQELEETDVKFTFTPIPVKNDEEKPQSSQFHQRQSEQMETEADGENCGRPEQARTSNPDTHLQPDTKDKTGDSSESETEDSDEYWNSLKNEKVPVNDSTCSAEEKPHICSECGKRFGRKGNLKRHMQSHTEEKPFSCSVCGKSFIRGGTLKRHMRVHTAEKPFSCTVCGKGFKRGEHLKSHARIHSGEKPFSCSVCGKSFTFSGHLKRHMRIHTGEKPFNCSVCKRSFSQCGHLKNHENSHRKETIQLPDV